MVRDKKTTGRTGMNAQTKVPRVYVKQSSEDCCCRNPSQDCGERSLNCDSSSCVHFNYRIKSTSPPTISILSHDQSHADQEQRNTDKGRRKSRRRGPSPHLAGAGSLILLVNRGGKEDEDSFAAQLLPTRFYRIVDVDSVVPKASTNDFSTINLGSLPRDLQIANIESDSTV